MRMTRTPNFQGVNNNEESKATCRSIDGNKYKNNILMKASRQCVHAHAKQVWGNGQFQQANDDTDNEESHLL